MKEYSGINKALQRVAGELINKTSKLAEPDTNINQEIKKLKEIEHDFTCFEEQRQLWDED